MTCCSCWKTLQRGWNHSSSVMVQTGVFGVILLIQGWLSRHSEFPSLQRGYPTSINLISNCLKGVAPAPSLLHIVSLLIVVIRFFCPFFDLKRVSVTNTQTLDFQPCPILSSWWLVDERVAALRVLQKLNYFSASLSECRSLQAGSSSFLSVCVFLSLICFISPYL